MKVSLLNHALRIGTSAAVLLGLCFILHGSAAQTRPQSDPNRIRAVIVGISRYPKLPGGQQLQFADRDALAFADALKELGVAPDNMRIVVGTAATTTAIKSAIGNWLAQTAAESDTAIIFFSGHGFVESKFGEVYLLGCDSDVKDPYSTALSVTEIQQALVKRVRATKVLLLADAMRRDFFDPDQEPIAAGSFTHAFSQLSAQRAGAAIMLANGPGEFSREGQRWDGHGAFTRHLLNTLSASSTALQGNELFDRLSIAIAQDTSGKQHAWRSGGEYLARISFPVTGRPLAETARSHGPEPPTRDAVRESPPQRKEQVSTSLPEVSAPGRRNTIPDNTVAPDARKVVSSIEATTDKSSATAANTSKNETPRTSPRVPQPSTSSPAYPAPSRVMRPSVEARKTNANASAPKPVASTNAPESASPAPPPVARINPPEAPTPSPAPLHPPAYPEGPLPPRPVAGPPATRAVDVSPNANHPSVSTSVPSVGEAAPRAPSPLLLQLEAALASGNLVEPRGASAWDSYQRLAAEGGYTGDLERLKPLLASALLARARAIVTQDIRSDNITNKLDDLKSAGEMLSRARSISATADIAQLEKLRAALALISLQFFDEAEQALTPLEGLQMASIDNALGLVYQGKLDSIRAERAFKRAIGIDAKLAAPHYNLAVLYRNAQNQAALTEFEAAASLDPSNVALLVSLGDEHFSRQQWQQAADAFRKAIKLRPNDDTLHTKLGHSLFSQGLTEEANREYQRANELRRTQ